MSLTPEPLELNTCLNKLQPRDHIAHKGHFGHVLVVGGDHGMPGAVRLAGEGALRVGAGLVTVATRPTHVSTTVCGRPELLCYGLNDTKPELSNLIEKATVLVVGPGLGQSTWSQQCFEQVLAASKPTLIDADGLNWLAKNNTVKQTQPHWILTPHPGEAARLLGATTQAIQADRINAIQSLHQRYGGVIVLKGADTLIMTADEPLTVCHAGNPGMASAGMGDVLSGIIAGLLAQGCTPWNAAQLGVCLHATAGDLAAKDTGRLSLLASDLFTQLPALLTT